MPPRRTPSIHTTHPFYTAFRHAATTSARLAHTQHTHTTPRQAPTLIFSSTPPPLGTYGTLPLHQGPSPLIQSPQYLLVRPCPVPIIHPNSVSPPSIHISPLSPPSYSRPSVILPPGHTPARSYSRPVILPPGHTHAPVILMPGHTHARSYSCPVILPTRPSYSLPPVSRRVILSRPSYSPGSYSPPCRNVP